MSRIERAIRLLVVGLGFLAAGLPARATPPRPRVTGVLFTDSRRVWEPRPVGADATMAADGVTALGIGWLDCFSLYGPGTWKLTLTSGSVAQDGGVAASADATRQTTAQATAVFTDGCWEAVLWYRVPDEFNRGGDGAIATRGITIQTQFTPDTGGPAILTFFIDLVRPPVVFVHGLWSNMDTWTFSLVEDPLFPVRKRADYQLTNAASFSRNSRVLRNVIDEALAMCSKQGIMCTQVDVVAHSMGGLLARIFSTSLAYAHLGNRFHGDIRKLITLDTPHRGSPLANFLLPFESDTGTAGAVMRDAFAKVRMPITGGAIDDLAVGSTALEALLACPVPAHALVGTGGPDALDTLLRPLGKYYELMKIVDVLTGTGLFSGQTHDGVVGHDSQVGGISSSATDEFGSSDGVHLHIPGIAVGNTGSPAYSARIQQLLDSPVSSSDWALFPAASLISLPLDDARGRLVEPRSVRSVDAPESPLTGLTITSPTSGATVSAGSTISVHVVQDAGLAIDQVVIVGQDEAASAGAPPVDVSFTVPPEAFGGYMLTAFGRNSATGEYHASASVPLTVQTSATLDAIELQPDDAILMGSGSTVQMHVVGQFSDDVPRDVPADLVSFSSTDAAIVTVDASGLATGHAEGNAEIHASYSGKSASRPLSVTAPSRFIFFDDFESTDFSWWSAVSK